MRTLILFSPLYFSLSPLLQMEGQARPAPTWSLLLAALKRAWAQAKSQRQSLQPQQLVSSVLRILYMCMLVNHVFHCLQIQANHHQSIYSGKGVFW